MMKPQLYVPTGKFWDLSLSVLNARRRLGYWPNFWQPRTFNEYFLHEKMAFGGDMTLARVLSHKMKVKDWLVAEGYSAYVTPTVRVVQSVGELRSTLIPARCVIKAAHSSGRVIINNASCERSLTTGELTQIEYWFKEDYYLRGREPNYAGLKPQVIVEELLLDETGQCPRDYKVFCAKGVPFMIQVDYNRFTAHDRQLYTVDWKLLPFVQVYPCGLTACPRPAQLSHALEIAGRLAAPFRLCRVDFYFIGETGIRIGEITFFPDNCAGAFEPRSGDAAAGRMIKALLDRDSCGRSAQGIVQP